MPWGESGIFSVTQNTTVMNSLFFLGIIPPSYPRVQHWEESTSVSLIAYVALTDVHRPGSELCTFTSCSFSSYVTTTNFAITDFFPNFSYQNPVQYKSTRAVTSSLMSSLSVWPRIHLKQLLFHRPPFEGHVGKVLWSDTPGKALGPFPEKLHTALICEKEWFSLFCFSYFLPFFIFEGPFFNPDRQCSCPQQLSLRLGETHTVCSICFMICKASF